MSTIDNAFRQSRAQGRAALIPYITAGFPDLAALPGLVAALTDAGADLIEIGIPFSDPLADGPVLQQAATAALAHGTRVRDILQAVKVVSGKTVPLLFLTYVNPILRYGFEDFCRDSHAAGIQGLIIPDLPWREGKPLRVTAQARELAVIPLVAPTSTDAHLMEIRRARGFVYGVSVTGVTGARGEVDQGVSPLVARVKSQVNLPVAIGFGISTPDQARQVGQVADGVIVGSALVNAIAAHPGNAEEVAFRFVRDMKEALTNIATKA